MTAFWSSERSPERSEDIGLEWVYLNQQHAQHFLTANGRDPTVTHLDAMGRWKSAVESNEKPLERPPGERVACENRRYWFNGEGEGLSQNNHLPNVHNIWIYTEWGALFFLIPGGSYPK